MHCPQRRGHISLARVYALTLRHPPPKAIVKQTEIWQHHNRVSDFSPSFCQPPAHFAVAAFSRRTSRRSFATQTPINKHCTVHFPHFIAHISHLRVFQWLRGARFFIPLLMHQSGFVAVVANFTRIRLEDVVLRHWYVKKMHSDDIVCDLRIQGSIFMCCIFIQQLMGYCEGKS